MYKTASLKSFDVHLSDWKGGQNVSDTHSHQTHTHTHTQTLLMSKFHELEYSLQQQAYATETHEISTSQHTHTQKCETDKNTTNNDIMVAENTLPVP